MARDTFIFYRDWLNALNEMPDNVQLEVYKSIAKYALDGNLSELSPLAKIAFSFVKPQIDRDMEKYNKVVERNRANGKLGGRKPKQTEETQENPVGYLETEKTQTNPKNLDNDNEYDNVNDNDNKNDIVLEIVPSKEETASKKKKFIKPTLEEVQSYIQEKGFTVNAQTFIDYYMSNGWRVGKNPMKDWKAAVRTWQQKEKQNVYGNNRTNYSKKQEANNYAFQQYLEEGERIARGERVYTSDPNSADNPF